MSRKPTIKISYPEASEKALQLTEAMVKRAPGKRIVETESEDPIFPDGGELFSGFIRCKTQTGVELTLTLNSSSMDYALETLIRPNLTTDERKRILGEDAEQTELPIPAQAAEAPGQVLDVSSSPDVPSAEREAATQSGERHLDLENIIHGALEDHKISAEYNDKLSFAEDLAKRIRLHEKVKAQGGEQEKQIEIGKIPDAELRNILTDMIVSMDEGTETADAIDNAVNEINYRAGEPHAHTREDAGLTDRLAVLICGAQRVTQKRTTPLKIYASDIDLYIKESFDDEAEYMVTARELARVLSDVQGNFAEDPNLTFEKALKIRAKARVDFEALKKDLDALDQQEPTRDDVEAEARSMGKKQDQDIEPGLLNDLDDGEEVEK